MSEADWVAHWERLATGMYLTDGFERKRPSSALLDALETRLGVRLPVSYRAFARTFGPGYLAKSFTVFAPGYAHAPVIDFMSRNQWQPHDAKWRTEPDQVLRVVAFSKFGYEFIGWDTGEVTDSAGHEYRIYRVPREEDEPLVPIAESFQSFVEDCCLDGRFWELFEATREEMWLDEDAGVPRSFRCFEPLGNGPGSDL